MSAIAILLISIIAAFSGFAAGFAFGNKRGRDEQWVDDLLERWRIDNSRRDAAGRFRAKGGAK